MSDVIQAVYQWQSDAGNLDRPYDDFLECSFQIEEALEGLNLQKFSSYDEDYGTDLSKPEVTAKAISRNIVTVATEGLGTVPDVDRFDKHVDGFIYHIGSLGKLGLTVDQICRGILAVNQANYQKLNAKRDAHGKLGKPTDFVPPESLLQQILDER
jgi:hypothetical protein